MSNVIFNVNVVDLRPEEVVKLSDGRYFIYRSYHGGELEEKDQLVLAGNTFLRAEDGSVYAQYVLDVERSVANRKPRFNEDTPHASWALALQAHYYVYRMRMVTIPASIARSDTVLLCDFTTDRIAMPFADVLEKCAPYEIHKGHLRVREWRNTDYSVKL